MHFIDFGTDDDGTAEGRVKCLHGNSCPIRVDWSKGKPAYLLPEGVNCAGNKYYSPAQARIVNGGLPRPNSWNFIVSLTFPGDEYGHSCGAAIVNEEWIITAGHCLVEFDTTIPIEIDELAVRIGSHDRRNGTGTGSYFFY